MIPWDMTLRNARGLSFFLAKPRSSAGCCVTLSLAFTEQSSPQPMPPIVRASFLYFALVLGAGFLLGSVRVPFIVPHLGERWAELAEMPIMAVIIFVAAGYILRRYPEVQTRGRALVVGFMALALSVSAELALAVVLQSQSLAEFLASRDKVSGSVYLVMLVAFALMPRLRLSRHL